MAQEIIPLTDEEVLAVADDPAAVAKFTSEERRRLQRLRPQQGARTARGRMFETAVDALPAAAATVGGIAGGMGGTVAGMGVGGAPGAIGGAALAGAAGEGGRQLLNRAMGRETPATAGEAASDIASEGAVQGGVQAVGAGVGGVMAKAAPWLMKTAVKVPKTIAEEFRTTPLRIVSTLLDEGVNVTANGIAKLQKLLTATNDEIRDIVQGASGEVPKELAAARALPTAAKLAQQTNPTKDLQAVGDTVEEFLNHPIYRGNLTVPEAHAMKVGTYRKIGDKYGELSSAQIETEKALARGLKEEVAEAVPDVARLNQRDSELMAAAEAVGRRVAVAGNRDPVGFAWVTQNPVSFLGALMDRSPAVKSMLARGMYESAAAAAQVSPALIRAALVSIASDDGANPSFAGAPVRVPASMSGDPARR